jgi:hypothetical protein
VLLHPLPDLPGSCRSGAWCGEVLILGAWWLRWGQVVKVLRWNKFSQNVIVVKGNSRRCGCTRNVSIASPFICGVQFVCVLLVSVEVMVGRRQRVNLASTAQTRRLLQTNITKYQNLNVLQNIKWLSAYTTMIRKNTSHISTFILKSEEEGGSKVMRDWNFPLYDTEVHALHLWYSSFLCQYHNIQQLKF